MKPQAPAEVRGEFKPIATSLPGLQICEHLPNTAKWMHKTSLIRTITHNHNSHNPLPILTGYTDGNPAALSPDPNDPPDVGAVCQYLGIGPRDVPGAVCLPCYPGWGEGHRRPGPYGGFLGRQYDPVFLSATLPLPLNQKLNITTPSWLWATPSCRALAALLICPPTASKIVNHFSPDLISPTENKSNPHRTLISIAISNEPSNF